MHRILRWMLFSIIVLSSAAWAHNEHGNDLTGSWRITATIPAGVPVCPGVQDCVYPALATATSDGTILQTAPISNTLTGQGSWKRVAPRSFKVHTIYFRVDPTTGNYVGTSETVIEVTVAKDGRTAQGSFAAVVLDVNGVEITHYTGTVTAQRILVQ